MKTTKIYFGELKQKKGVIHVNREQCKGCGFCVEYCPNDVLALSSEFNSKGYHPPEIVNEDECVYCQLCETICPEFALFVTLAEEFVTLAEEVEELEKSESRP